MAELLNTTPTSSTTPSFLAKVEFAGTGIGEAVAIGDLNADDKPDIAAACSGNVAVLHNTTPNGAGTASFSTSTNFTTGEYAWGAAIGDVDGDGKKDLVIANNGADGGVSILLNQTANGATEPSFSGSDIFVNASARYVVIGDLTGDGKADIATANYSGDSITAICQ